MKKQYRLITAALTALVLCLGLVGCAAQKLPEGFDADEVGTAAEEIVGLATAGILTATPGLADPQAVPFGQSAEIPSPGGAINYTVSDLQPSGHNDGIWYSDVTATAVSGTPTPNIADFNARDRAVQMSFLDGDEVAADAVPDKLAYIVILIDEMADLMLVAQAEIENRIARLAQLSRAAGIHMILATQRPSVNVITGTIKANFPGRIAFQVTQKVDSRTILDTGGADALIGRGDMLFLNPQGSTLIRAQGAWVDDPEIRGLVSCLKAQGKPVYEAAIKERLDKVVATEPGDDFDGGGEGGEGEGTEDADEQLLQQALAIIRETRRATTSALQRRLRIGYNRAARLMEELEQRGYIGPANGNDPREILVDLEGEMPDSGAQ